MSAQEHTDLPFTLELEPVEWALIHYYSAKKGLTRREAVHRIVGAHAAADKTFDPRDFVVFVKSQLLRKDGDMPHRERLLRHVMHYAEDRRLADEPTVTLASAPARSSKRQRP
jgi:hypothetical protein